MNLRISTKDSRDRWSNCFSGFKGAGKVSCSDGWYGRSHVHGKPLCGPSTIQLASDMGYKARQSWRHCAKKTHQNDSSLQFKVNVNSKEPRIQFGAILSQEQEEREQIYCSSSAQQ